MEEDFESDAPDCDGVVFLWVVFFWPFFLYRGRPSRVVVLFFFSSFRERAASSDSASLLEVAMGRLPRLC